MKERIQKILSRHGIASRRKIENLVKQGRVQINGKNAILGSLVSKEDLIKIDGKKIDLLNLDFPLRVLMYHKKIGEISKCPGEMVGD